MRKIAFFCDEFSGAAPQLFDRLLAGYPADGRFHRPGDWRLAAHVARPADREPLEARAREFKFSMSDRAEEVLAEADAILVVGKGPAPDEKLIETVLQAAAPGSRCFVHGALGRRSESATRFHALARERRVVLAAGTSRRVIARLPDSPAPLRVRASEALVTVHGAAPDAEFEGAEALLSLIFAARPSPGLKEARLISGPAVWQRDGPAVWAPDLLAAALSRSHTVQGHPIKDGRTQDIYGLGLLPKLATDPRVWSLELEDGLRVTIVVLTGAIADYNFALRTGDGKVISGQFYRPTALIRDEFNRLTAVIENFFRSGRDPWPHLRPELFADLTGRFGVAQTF